MKKLKRLSKRLTALILSVVMTLLVTAVQTNAISINDSPDRNGYIHNLKCTCGKFDHRLSLGKGESVSYSVGQNYYGSIKIANLATSGRGVSDSVKASVKTISPVLSKVTFTGLRNNDGYYDYINMYLSSNKAKQGICHAITVYDAPKFIKLNKTSINLKVGQTYLLQERTNKGSYANNQNIKWISSNTGVKVEKRAGGKALVTAVKKCSTYINVYTYNGLYASCRVTVK